MTYLLSAFRRLHLWGGGRRSTAVEPAGTARAPQQRPPSCGLPAAGGGWLPVARWKKSV